MKLKERLAVDAVEERDFIKNENRRAYGEGFLAGFNKARELAIEHLNNTAAWAFEGCNSGDSNVNECMIEERVLREQAVKLRKLGEKKFYDSK